MSHEQSKNVSPARDTDDPVAEMVQQNQELLQALDELHRRQNELVELNSELEDTNRGVVALYAELDEKADHLRRADELKSRFLSNMSHEFRTPLNSILALSRLLLDRLDGPLTDEQVKQISFVRKAAQDLFELINDLLDLAKIESGKLSLMLDATIVPCPCPVISYASTTALPLASLKWTVWTIELGL
jgi:signal transduction histidine kinase